MTRLFLRFYLGVIAILIGAGLIQSYVTRISSTQNIPVIEKALSGGARLARSQLLDTPASSESGSDMSARLETVQSEFEYPVRVVANSSLDLDDAAQRRLDDDEAVLSGLSLLLDMPTEGKVLRLGPLPAFVGPSQVLTTLATGVVLIAAAIAIAVLLNPVALQLRAVERAALAIAEGDLSARINPSDVPKGLPLARAFNLMADRTEKLLQSQRELLQAVSHELRTPLARIQFATDLIGSATTDEERRTRLASVDSATQRLDDLVGELLTYVRLESEESDYEMESINLYNLFEELVENHAPLYPSIQFEIDDESKPVSVFADRRSLGRAVGNLLANAGRYARQRVLITAKRSVDGVRIQIDDDGAGIPVEDRMRIFDPFVRLEDNHVAGTGLGLALVNRIATRHGGSVIATESPFGGARFSLFLPLT